MSRKARGSRRYVIEDGSTRTEVRVEQFAEAVHSGCVAVSAKDRKKAVVKPDYQMWIDHTAGGQIRFSLKVTPERDPAAIRSWWALLVYRHAFYYGEKSIVLYSWAAQVEGLR